jgi:Zn-dependent protease
MDPKLRRRLPLHIFLFVITLIATTLAGAEWVNMKVVWIDFGWKDFVGGLAFSLPFLTFLTVHEFGHYFTARAHKVKVSLPYFIPLWLNLLLPLTGAFMPSIGTMGAVIRIREYINSRKVHFDIGIAGPLAGFVVSLFVLWWGFTHLPPQDYIFQIHPEYQELGPNWQQEAYVLNPANEEAGLFYLGKNLLYMFFERYVASDPARVPNAYEIIHYPWLFAGFLGLFFTALNLLPIGQLDGGHILYGLVGYRWHRRIATALFVALVFWAGLGIPSPEPGEEGGALFRLLLYAAFLYYLFGRMRLGVGGRIILALCVLLAQMLVGYLMPGTEGYMGWMLFAFLIGRFLGVYHPKTPIDEPLSPGRKVLGWLALAIFILCFSPEPFVFVGG